MRIRRDYIDYIVYCLVVVLFILVLPRWLWYIVLFVLLGVLVFILYKLHVFDYFIR